MTLDILDWLASLLKEHNNTLEIDNSASNLGAHPLSCKIIYKNTSHYFQFRYPSADGKKQCFFKFNPDFQGQTKEYSFEGEIKSVQDIINNFNIWFKNVSQKIALLNKLEPTGVIKYPTKGDRVSEAYLNSIHIQDFFCIKQSEIHDLAASKEVYFLGENGDGKTLLLQSIVLNLIEIFFYLESAEKSEMPNLLSLIKHLRATSSILKLEDNSIHSITTNEGLPIWVQNIFAYGISRGQTYGESDNYGFLTLFDKSKILKNPVDWLKDLRLKELEGGINYKGLSSQGAIAILENLTDEHNLKIEIKNGEVSFLERGFNISFEQLSEGYRNVLIWVTDLVARLTERQPDFSTINYEEGSVGYDFRAIVLVDEINLHLHPKWEYQIVRKLRKWFPLIQFFFTTHSPMTILGASKDAIFYRLYKENGITQISQPYLAEQMNNWLANILITSPLFDMDSARVAFFDESQGADTAEDSLSSQIRKTVKLEIAKIKKQKGTTYLPPEAVQQIIDNALQKAKYKP